MTRVKVIGAVIAVGLVLTVFLQNLDPVPFRFAFWKVHVAKTLLIAGSAVVGAAAGLLVPWYVRRSRRSSDTRIVPPAA